VEVAFAGVLVWAAEVNTGTLQQLMCERREVEVSE
jgi:hypothetical protein